MIIRIVAFALLFAVMIPISWGIKTGVAGMSEYWKDMGFAAFCGFAACYGLWRWEERDRQRNRSD